MALNQTNKLTWIVETIYNAHKISFEDLNEKWMDNIDMSGGQEMLKRTFHKWREKIADTFGIDIACEKAFPYRYYIEDESVLRKGSIGKWLLDTYSVSNSLIECKSLKDRILLEDVPSGRYYLDAIIKAMKESHPLNITYYNYWRNDERCHTIDPYCVKLFRQRWYVVGNLHGLEKPIIFSLDRIEELSVVGGKKFKYPKDFSPKDYFDGCFGVYAGTGTEIEKVRIKANAGQANYLRDLPLHPSQKEVEEKDDYSIFELKIRPTYDFLQEMLWNGANIEVLEPEWFRKQVGDMIKRMNKKYNKK